MGHIENPRLARLLAAGHFPPSATAALAEKALSHSGFEGAIDEEALYRFREAAELAKERPTAAHLVKLVQRALTAATSHLDCEDEARTVQEHLEAHFLRILDEETSRNVLAAQMRAGGLP